MDIRDFIEKKTYKGLVISGEKISSPTTIIRTLRYYSITNKTDAIILNNQDWAKTGQGQPQFQFVYLMLPTSCNQQCAGCFMGQDKSRLPPALSGPFWSPTELNYIISVVKKYGTKAIVYGGGGELFTWKNAFRFIKQIVTSDLGMVIFTNGSLLSPQQIKQLNEWGVALIISLRDTVEIKHNAIIRRPYFQKTLNCIIDCLDCGMQTDGRLAVEMPITHDNAKRILNDFLPVCRALGIVPWIEEFITISASAKEKAECNTFTEVREFFKLASEKDLELGINWTPEYGQRMLDQPQCRRPLYSFAIFPSGDVLDCPSHTVQYGNMRKEPLEKIIVSDRLREGILNFDLCPCSRFYTESNNQIPPDLPTHLKEVPS